MSPDSLNDAMKDTKRAARDLAVASARLSKRLLEKAEAAAKDSKSSTTKASKAVARKLDAAAKEVDRILKSL
jgi:hypothetical protein